MSRRNANPVVENNPAANNSAMFKKLENDNVFVNVGMEKLSDLTGKPGLSKFKWAVVTEGEITNIVSEKFRILKNEDFFLKMEEALINADIQYKTRSINRKNHHFAVDYILNDENFQVNVKNGMDKVTPMIRLVNSYAGAATSGSFGFYREVCTNSLNIAQSKVGFKIAHMGDIDTIVVPKIGELVNTFMSNEYYSLHRKFEVLAETPITNMEEYIRYTVTKLDLFKYEASEKNPAPSKNAQIIIDSINNEANTLQIQPNMWLGYNAVQEWINGSARSFAKQQILDKQAFNLAMEMAN